jgi:hypothetical protein
MSMDLGDIQPAFEVIKPLFGLPEGVIWYFMGRNYASEVYVVSVMVVSTTIILMSK